MKPELEALNPILTAVLNHLIEIILVMVLSLLTATVFVVRDLIRDLMAAGAIKLAEVFPIVFRGGLYFAAAFLAAIVDKLGEILFHDNWPSLPRTIGAFLAGTLSGVIAVRAYNDGSAQRYTEQIESKRAAKLFETPSPALRSALTPPPSGSSVAQTETTETPNKPL